MIHRRRKRVKTTTPIDPKQVGATAHRAAIELLDAIIPCDPPLYDAAVAWMIEVASNYLALLRSNRILALRRTARMSQAQLAERLGTSGSAVARWEAGKHLASAETLAKITRACKQPQAAQVARDTKKGRKR